MNELEEGQASGGVETRRRVRRTRIGVVESDGRAKTISVRIDRLLKHWKYGKYLRRSKVFCAHDEKNEARRGDTVEIMECRRLSKTKSWRLSRIVRRFGES